MDTPIGGTRRGTRQRAEIAALRPRMRDETGCLERALSGVRVCWLLAPIPERLLSLPTHEPRNRFQVIGKLLRRSRVSARIVLSDELLNLIDQS
jgi:hypothetical protein